MQQSPPQQLTPPDLASPQLAAAETPSPGRPAGVPACPTRVRQPGGQAAPPDVVAIQRLNVPEWAPPYDDEVQTSRTELTGIPNHPIPAMHDSLAERHSPERHGPGRPSPERHSPERPSPERYDGGYGTPGQHSDPSERHRPDQQVRSGGPPVTASADRRDAADGWPRHFAQVLAETLAGSRPAHQLTPWTTEHARRRIRQLGPLLATDQRPRVRRVLSFAPAADVLELTAIVGFGPRVRALALRLEREESRLTGRSGSKWCCTAIESA